MHGYGLCGMGKVEGLFVARGLWKRACAAGKTPWSVHMGTHLILRHSVHGLGFDNDHPVLELAMLSTSISVAPQAVNSSITDAMFPFSTIELTATQSGSSNAVMVGALFPGVIFVAVSRPLRAMLYWQRMNFWAARLW